MKLGKPLLLGHIRVPHPDRAVNADFPHEEAIHPTEGELHKLDSLILEMLRETGVDSHCQVSKCADLADNARLGEDVVVLDAIEEFGETPE